MFKKGDIIYHGWSDACYITENINSKDRWVEGRSVLRVNKKEFDQKINYVNNPGIIYRLATPEEERWFKECVKRGKYIPFEEINQYYEIY